MDTLLCRAALGAVFALGAVPGLHAQQRPLTPHIGYAYPAGARPGDEITLTVGGQALAGATAVTVSGTGVLATVESYTRPMTQRQASALRDKLQAAREKTRSAEPAGARRPGLGSALMLMRLAREAGVTDAEVKALLEYQRARSDPKRQPNPQLEERLAVRLKVDPQAAPGVRDLRVLTSRGLSNPIRFVVGRWPEQRENEPNDRIPDAIAAGELPAVLNGQITPGDVDRYSFTVRQGTHLIVAVSARDLIPYLADAVPGWFQAVVTLFDEKGSEVAYADDYRFSPDPVLHYQVPVDGRYVLEVRDALYRGREDFVYRVMIGALPYLTSIFPLGGRGGATVQARGWNLPASTLPVAAPGAGTREAAVGGETGANALPYAVEELPGCLEKEPNDRVAQAQSLGPSAVVNGRIGRPGDVDVYRITGRRGSTVVAEVTARRLGSPLDSAIALTDASGRRVAANDDSDDRGAGLLTHQADSYVRARLPATGTYYLAVRDAQRAGGSEYAYRLRVGPPRPDFDLLVTPASISGRAGANVPVVVHAVRRDGFSGPVVLSLDGAPAGYVLSGGVVPAGQDRARMTLTLPRVPVPGPVALHMVGRAAIGGHDVARPALPAEDMMQAFAYQHLVPAQEWTAAVVGRAALGPALRSRDAGPVRILRGGTARLEIAGLPAWQPEKLAFELSEPPAGLSLAGCAVAPAGATLTLRADRARTARGLQGNLIVEAFREVTLQAAGAAKGGKRRVPLGPLPAIPFVVEGP